MKPSADALTEPAGSSLLWTPAAVWLVLTVLGGALADPAAAAESRYLAVLCAGCLLSASLLGKPNPLRIATIGVLIVTVAVTVPLGAARGAAISCLVLVALTVGAVEQWRSEPGRLRPGPAVAAAIGVQLLARAEVWLGATPGPETIAILVALPTAGAAAVVALARQHGAVPALLATGVLLAISGGWTAVSVLTLAAFAVARSVFDGRPWWRFSVTGTIVAASVVADPWFVLLLGAAIAAFLLPASWRLHLAIATAVVLAMVLTARTDAGRALSELSWLPLLLPAACFRRRPDPRLFTAAALALAGLQLVHPEPALAAPLVLASLATAWRPSAATALQAAWTGALLWGGLLLAAYPWLRDAPLRSLLPLLSLEPGWTAVIVVGAVTWSLIAVERLIRRRRRPSASDLHKGLLTTACFLIAVGMLAALPRASVRPLGDDVLVLNGERPLWSADLQSRGPVTRLVVDSQVAQSLRLPQATPIADVRLLATDGRVEHRTLVIGRDTGEWAARRPDVVGTAGLETPIPWISWVTPERFLAQRYRARHELAAPLEVTRVEIERRPELGAEVSLSVFHLELSR